MKFITVAIHSTIYANIIDPRSIFWNGRYTNWYSADGTVRRICNMTTSHIINTINMLKSDRYIQFYYVKDRYIHFLEQELVRRQAKPVSTYEKLCRL